jgi:hypothetical protein
MADIQEVMAVMGDIQEVMAVMEDSPEVACMEVVFRTVTPLPQPEAPVSMDKLL